MKLPTPWINNRHVSLLGAMMVFLIDLFTPPGIAVGALYMFCFLFISGEKPKIILRFSALFILLILIKVALRFDASTPLSAYENRGISIFIIMASAWLCIRHRRFIEHSNARIQNQHNELIQLESDYLKRFDSMMEGIQILDFDWRYVYVNESVVKQSRLTKADLIGHTILEKYPGVESSDLFKALKRCMEERCIDHFDNEFVFPDGTRQYFELIIQPVQQGILILSLDIAERKEAEEQRKEQIRMLEELLFMISHKVRQPVANILGISNTLNDLDITHEELCTMSNYMKESAVKLDVLTKELNDIIAQSRALKK